MSVVASTKRYVADERCRLRLFDCIADESRRVAAALREPQFSTQGSWSDDEFRRRVAALDELLVDLYHAEALVGRWGTPAMRDSLTLGPKRLSDGAGEGTGTLGSWRSSGIPRWRCRMRGELRPWPPNPTAHCWP